MSNNKLFLIVLILLGSCVAIWGYRRVANHVGNQMIYQIEHPDGEINPDNVIADPPPEPDTKNEIKKYRQWKIRKAKPKPKPKPEPPEEFGEASYYQ